MARISVEIPDALDTRMSRFLFYGAKSTVIRMLCENLCEAVEQKGIGIVTLILEGKYNLVSKTVKEEE